MHVWWGLSLIMAIATSCLGGSPQTGVMTLRAGNPRPVAPAVRPSELARRLTEMQPQWPRQPVQAGVDCAKAKCVALTFDDGPGDYTLHLLDLLKERGVRVTFFLVGEMVAADHRQALRRMVHDGHELGNHSWSHAQLTTLTSSGIRSQLARTQEIVTARTGVRMEIMRPPYGSTDSRVSAESRREGLAQILWNVDTLDWRDRDSAVVARRAAKASPGSIVLMHDIHRTTVAAVPSLISSLVRRGFTFVTISELYGKRPAPGRKYTER